MAKPITISHQVRSAGWESMISANGGLLAHRYTPQVTKDGHGGPNRLHTAPNKDFFSLSLSLLLSLSVSLLGQPRKASAQNSVQCSRESGSQHTVPKNQYHQMIKVRYQCLAHRYTPQVTQRWPRGSEPASPPFSERCIRSEVIEERTGGPQWAPNPPPHVPRTHGGPTYVVGVPHAQREG